MDGKNIPVLGKGENVYQFIHANDLADSMILAAHPKVRSGIFNIGAEKFGTMREVLSNLCDYAGTGSKVKNIPFGPAVFGMKISSFFNLSPLGSYHALMYGRSMYFDISKSKRVLNWSPKYSNNDMFIETYDWYVKNREKIILGDGNGSHHQSVVKQGILNIVKNII